MTIYNNPAMAQAAQNLASIFAPPSGSDLAGYAKAGATREQAARLAQLFADPNMPEWDKRAIASGLYNPTQSFYAQDQNNATVQRGQDIGYKANIDVANINNAGALERQNAAPILIGENQTAVLPQQTQAATGLGGILSGNINVAPGEVTYTPGGEVVTGPEKPMTESEMIASIIAGMAPEMQTAVAFGNTPLEQIIMDDGTAQFATRPDAIGQAPAPTGQEGARKDAVAVINGQTVPVTRAPNDLQWRTADGQPIPPDAQVFSLPAPTGSAEDVGMTTATASGVQGRLIATQQTLGTAQRLLDTIRSNPSSQGVAGMLRGTAQDVIQTGGELGQLLGGGVAEVSNAINNGMVEAGIGSEFFDPSIPAIDMLTNLLAWQYAKSLSGERVSNEQLRQARSAIGGENLFSNQANSEARLTTLIDMLQGQQAELQTLMPGFGIAPSGGPSAGPTPPTPPVPPQPPAPPTGGQSQLPDYTQYDALPSGARFLDPEGNIREKP